MGCFGCFFAHEKLVSGKFQQVYKYMYIAVDQQTNLQQLGASQILSPADRRCASWRSCRLDPAFKKKLNACFLQQQLASMESNHFH